ncbi:fatty acid synthase alpha subunit Lsd1, partial [Coemansia sp. RSA 1085]
MASKLLIELNDTSIEIYVPSEILLHVQDLANSFAQTGVAVTSPIELYAQFIVYCAEHSQDVAVSVLKAFCQTYRIPETNIHVVVQQQNLDDFAARLVIKAYYSQWNMEAARDCYVGSTSTCIPELFASESTRVMAMFGGQPGTSAYFDEIIWMLDVYKPILASYSERMFAFLNAAASDSRFSLCYRSGFDVKSWIKYPQHAPDAEYLVSAPISMPLTGFAQLMHVMVLFKTLNISPGELAQLFKASVGHSQGIAIAAAFSMMSDEHSFYEISTKILGLLLLIGAVPQIEHPNYIFDDNSTELTFADSTPRPMVYVRGISKDALCSLITDFNCTRQSEAEHVHLAVVNSYDQFVVAGTVLSTVKLVRFLNKKSADPALDQSKIPFNLRRPVITASYVDITVPYHCELLASSVDVIAAMAADKGWLLDAADMQIPVRACDTGKDIGGDITRYLAESICVLPVNWPQAIAAAGITHMVDFGTGGFNGFGQLAFKNVEGSGTSVICVGALTSQHSSLECKASLWQVSTAVNWLSEWGPQLQQTASGIHIDNQMQRVLGLPTVMVAGMTPTTANVQLVAAISNAGYHVELAGGGIHSERDIKDRINQLARAIPPGHGITLNCIYINPRQWQFQFPALLQMRRQGLPITGLCIGGGVPSTGKALDIIEELQAAGIRHIAFKPSTAEAIRQVVQIAQQVLFPIILQWTGGRGGGHHSFEDFHQPILETYAAIRACKNIVLVAGSGFGDAQGSWPYIAGDWSIEFGRAPMPFDGVLLGSRVMIAKEAGTSSAVKEMIAATPGLSDAEWYQTYQNAGQGVTTITSEYGELNHMLVTRAALFIRDIYSSVLTQPREKREALLLARKDEVISRLNSDFMRPWFGKKADGRVVDLEDMTYVEVIDRAVELMYVTHQQRWISPTYLQFVLRFIDRTERRMCTAVPEVALSAELYDADPQSFARRIGDAYPKASTCLLTSEDAQLFIAQCKQGGQKPPPFVPVLDADFGTLLMKDTIWQSDDLDSVFDQDPQRLLVQQGPVAAKYSTVIDEPVREILDSIYHGHINLLVERLYCGNKERIPFVESVAVEPLVGSVIMQESDTERTFSINVELPDQDKWLRLLAGSSKNWLHALLTTPLIVQGARYAENYVRRLLRPRPGRTVTIQLEDSALSITNAAGMQELTLKYNSASHTIHLTIYHMSLKGIVVPFALEFSYCPEQSVTPIHGSKQRDDEAARQLCIDTWVANSEHPVEFDDVTDSTATIRSELQLTEDHVREFCKSVGNRSWQYAFAKDGILLAPMEFTHIGLMRNSLRVLNSTVFGVGQVSIVHLYNEFRFENGAPMLRANDQLSSVTYVDGLINQSPGKKITLISDVFVRGQKIGTLDSAFLSRSHYIQPSQAFKRDRQQRFKIILPSAADVTVLEAKEWFIYQDNGAERLKPNIPYEFCLDSEYRFENDDTYSSITTSGAVTTSGQSQPIAQVDFQWGVAIKNPVIEFLLRYQVASDNHMLANGGYSLVTAANSHRVRATVPDDNWSYARDSLDGNPFHLNPYVADYADLPGTITHGLWTNASTRAIVEAIAADGQPERIRAYRTEFIDKVFPKDQLTTELYHIGMRNGRMLIKGQTSKVDSGPVMDITAEIDQPRTAYVFTGQGSQEVGMGMELYEQSSAARAIWDRANTHMLKTYDIDLLDIVRNNPTEATVYFTGRAGEAIRRNYMALTKRDEDKSSLLPIIPEITARSMSYTFRSPKGLLNATQFTQTALILVAMAAIADMQANGLIQADAMFAGHSLGEYCALAALGDIFTIEGLLDITFYRGLIMQSAVPRDDQGHSEFGMVAVDPSRVGKAFSESTLVAVIDSICAASPGLLQLVNFNVRGQQYVAAGTLTNLAVLRLVLDKLAAGSTYDNNTSQIIEQVLAEPFSTAPVRGKATIPLPGIDVPFHSKQLLNGVSEFRTALLTKINGDTVNPELLYHRYIPNVTAAPFEVTREYFDMVLCETGSPIISDILANWNSDNLNDPVQKKHLAVTLLIELLAYQLASPVQWIKTQDHLFGAAEVQRVIEIGPSPILCGMAAKTQRNSAWTDIKAALFHFERNHDEIYYLRATETSDAEDPQPEDTPKTVDQPSAPVLQEPDHKVPPNASTGALTPVDDVPIQAVNIVQAIVAFKLKQPLNRVPTEQTIKSLVAGKSTLQNEIVGDLQKEFGTLPDKPEEVSLAELGLSLGQVTALGKCMQSLLARMISSKMPGGFNLSTIKAQLSASYGLGPQRQDALLALALTMEPSARISSHAEATAWLDQVAQAYAVHAGISYATASAETTSNAAGPVVSSAELDKMRQHETEHIQRQIAVLARYAGIDLRADGRSASKHQSSAQQLQADIDDITAEMGNDLLSGVRPRFDARKMRRFDSFWNWARQDAYEWIQQTLTAHLPDYESAQVESDDGARIQRLQNCAHVELVEMLAGVLKVLEKSKDTVPHSAIVLVRKLYDTCQSALDDSPLYMENSKPVQPKTTISSDGDISYMEVPRPGTFIEYIQSLSCKDINGVPPLIHICEQANNDRWTYSDAYSSAYFNALADIAAQGISFAGKTALVTGCGQGSIGAEIVCRLLAGGARVVATTSSYSRKTLLSFENMYRKHGSRGSELVVVPFNQGSVQDIDRLVHYILGKSADNLGWNLDFVFPFAALSDIGSTATNIGSRSELAQRVMLTNVLRLLGRIKEVKENSRRTSCPSLVVLPLSPNHGNFGGDGLYGECKLALETTFNRWESEGWEGFLSIAGAVIGWTRGTGLMSANNLVAQGIEDHGIRTFSTSEMAFNIMGLLHPLVAHIAHQQPVWASLTGGMDRVHRLSKVVKEIRDSMEKKSSLLRLIKQEKAIDYEMTHPTPHSRPHIISDQSPLAKHRSHFPSPQSYQNLQHLHHLQDMVNLDKVVVITGYGE